LTTTLKKWFVCAGLAQQQQSSLSRKHCTRGLQQQYLGGEFTWALLVRVWEGTSSQSWTPTQVPRYYLCPARRPGIQWQYFLNCAPNMVFQKNRQRLRTQFTRHEFRDFRYAISISHILSPPYHPQSNWGAERFVDTIKRGLLKLRGDKILDILLLAYRTTPSSILPQPRCPAELFFGRKPRMTLDLLPNKQPTGRDIKYGKPIQPPTWSSRGQLWRGRLYSIPPISWLEGMTSP
jgi:hypothetical protein